jgi:type II secretory pathway component GspD/PulD (secretin)
MNPVLMLAGIALALALFAPGMSAQTQSPDAKAGEPKASPDTYKTIYLTNLTQQNEINDLQTDLRNMIPKAKMYSVATQNAISIDGAPEDVLLAQKMVADLDRARKIYRLTYTITETDSGKRLGAQHVALIVASGQKTEFKQGSRVPIVTGTFDAGSSRSNSQVQYVDVGLNIEASVDGYVDGLRLRTKVEQSSLAEEKSGLGAQDPVIRQTVLEGTPALALGKPLVLGSIDLPGSTRTQEIEVVADLVK